MNTAAAVTGATSTELILGLVTVIVSAVSGVLAHRAARSGGRAANAAEDVAARTRTNHGTDHIGNKVDDITDALTGMAERIDAGHEVIEKLAGQFVEVRDALSDHLAAPHTRPRARKAAAAVDLDAVGRALAPKPRTTKASRTPGA
jgi:hypothetical protein